MTQAWAPLLGGPDARPLLPLPPPSSGSEPALAVCGRGWGKVKGSSAAPRVALDRRDTSVGPTAVAVASIQNPAGGAAAGILSALVTKHLPTAGLHVNEEYYAHLPVESENWSFASSSSSGAARVAWAPTGAQQPQPQKRQHAYHSQPAVSCTSALVGMAPPHLTPGGTLGAAGANYRRRACGPQSAEERARAVRRRRRYIAQVRMLH